MIKPLYQHIATIVGALHNCQASGNAFASRHREALNYIADNLLPSGSGVDRGTAIDWAESTSEKIVLRFSFHHMDENGFYVGWTDHQAIVTALLVSAISIRITGKDRNQIKDYLYQTFDHYLTMEYEHSYDRATETDVFTRKE